MKRIPVRAAGLAVLCVLASRVAAVPAVAPTPLQVRVYTNAAMPRQAYLRRESLPVTVEVRQTGGVPRGVVRIELVEDRGGPVEAVRSMFQKTCRVGAATDDVASVRVDIPLAEYCRGMYRVRAAWSWGTNTLEAQAPVRVCADPVTNGLVFGMWWESAYKKQGTAEIVSRFGEYGLNTLQTMVVYPELLDECLWQGIRCVSITHGSAVGPDGKPIETGQRLRASGEPFTIGKDQPRWSIASTEWQKAMASSIGREVAKYVEHPAYVPMICTSDDYLNWTGLDYHPENVRRFKDLTGLEAPRPPEAMQNAYPVTVARSTGVIPDDDPWVAWTRFLSRDVLGQYDRFVAKAVSDATGGRGRIGPVSGGGLEDVMGFVPYVDILSGQWPPYNFGANGFSLLCCYNYNFYRYPALTQVWWYELGRMGNRAMPQWLMPDTMDRRRAVHLQNFYLYMAAAQDGIVYFIHERTTPGAWDALQRLVPVQRPLAPLLSAIKPAPRTVGLLMPFEQVCFRSQYPVDAQYAFCNLMMAQAEAEPVFPDELAAGAVSPKVLLLHDVDWLTKGSLRTVESFIRSGGTVLVDSLTEVSIPGAVRLDFALGTADRRAGYGDTNSIARVRAAVAERARPWAWADDPHWWVRRFHLDGVDYLWVVDLMTRQEDLDHVPAPGHIRDVDPLPAYRDAELGSRTGTVHVTSAGAAVYDVLKGRRLPATTNGASLTVPVETGRWQGTLLAFYPRAPERLEIRGPGKGRAGKACQLDVRVLSGRQPVAASFPLELTVMDSAGALNREYSRTMLAGRGEARIRLPFAVNDVPGTWRIRVRECSTGLEAEQVIQLEGR